jgi:aminopeptidase N
MRFHHTPQFIFLSLFALAALAAAQAPSPQAPSRANILRGEYSQWRANNDLLSYDLDVRVNPEKKFISGKNTIRFRMLNEDARIQLDLFANLNVDKILHGATELKYRRELGTVFVDFPAPLKRGSVQFIEFYYSGSPQETGRFGGISFRKDPAGRRWITTACQGVGASVWWPNKDQQRDEVENMRLRVAIPNALTDVSNGRLVGKTDLGDGYKAKVRNRQPIITARGVNQTPSQDQYFKGALFLNTLRSVVDNDARWRQLLRDYCRRFKYRNIMTEDVVAFFNKQTGRNLTAIFRRPGRRSSQRRNGRP